MKNLKEYVLPQLPHILDTKITNLSRTYIKENYITTNNTIVQLTNGTILNDFNTFIEYNHITNIDENVYLFYLDSIFNKIYQYGYDGLQYRYEDYQKSIYETLNYSYDSKKLVDKLNEISNIIDVKYINPKRKITQFEISFNTYNEITELLANEKFWQLIHLYNYYIKTIIDDKNVIIFEPYKPEDITNEIYNKLHGIIYHITTKEKYIAGIKNKELAPKWKGEWNKLANKPYDIWRDGRIFFIGNNDKNVVKQQLISIKNTSDILRKNDCIVLKIDLNKYHKLKFRIDSSASGYDAYFTEEPIPDFCITCINLDTWKKIDKKTL